MDDHLWWLTMLCLFIYSFTIQQTSGWPLQLLSVACLSLAAKMEEPLVPSLLDLQVYFVFNKLSGIKIITSTIFSLFQRALVLFQHNAICAGRGCQIYLWTKNNSQNGTACAHGFGMETAISDSIQFYWFLCMQARSNRNIFRVSDFKGNGYHFIQYQRYYFCRCKWFLFSFCRLI